MPISFNWDFEEKDPDPSHPDGITPPTGRRRRWLISIATLLILLGAGGLATRAWLNSKLEAVEKIEAELRSLVKLELKTIADGDEELFRRIQDPNIPRWRGQQTAHYISNLFGNWGESDASVPAGGFAPAPGLAAADRPPEINQVRVFGRLGRVKLILWFQPAPSEGLVSLVDPSLARWFESTPLPFHVTWFYRLDVDGIWYHTIPPDDYAGVPHSWHGTWLDIHATKVEAEALDTVAADLAALVYSGCQLLDCPRGARYVLNFDNALTPQVYGNRWRLPAPYLTGLPEEPLVREVWARALKLWVVEALVRSRIGSAATERVLYHHLVARLQVELGLAEPLALDVEFLTQALGEGEQHSLQSLWEARYDPRDPGGNRLLDAEAMALLQWIEGQVGAEQLFELVTALRGYQQFDAALFAAYHLPASSFRVEWPAYLSELTGVAVSALSIPKVPQALEPPPTPPRPQIHPGDQLAYICDNRVWVSNADGSNRVLLSASDQRFNGLYWSPDGRWLLTSWQHGRGGESAPYLLAADGSGGRLLTDDVSPEDVAFVAGWSPDGRQAVYYVYRGVTDRETETWAADVETGETRQLPGLPMWSPDEEHLVYVAGWLNLQGSAVWLADADGENARQVADRAWIGGRGAWSPDGSQLALTLLDDEPAQNTVVLYDLATANITPLLTAAELTALVSSSIQSGDVITDSAGRPLHILWPVGWSADERRLVISAQAASRGANDTPPAALAVAPLDGSSSQVLAHGEFYANAIWSPTDPDQLTFAQFEPRPLENRTAYLFDLNAGPMYTATQSWGGAWSPDGTWVAFAGQNPLVVVDQRGRARFTPGGSGSCPLVAWNPAADLSALDRITALTLTSAGEGWRFDNVRVYWDQDRQSLHAWGELVNQSGSTQRVLNLAPASARDGEGNPINLHFALSSSFLQLTRSASLADERDLPFDFAIPLPDDVQAVEGAEIVVQVVAEPAEPGREALDISTNEYDLSAWPETFDVSGAWENPGPDLDEHAAIVVTLYGQDGQVLGWGWRDESEPAYLASGMHDFAIEITLSDIVADLGLPVGSYKVQLFAH